MLCIMDKMILGIYAVCEQLKKHIYVGSSDRVDESNSGSLIVYNYTLIEKQKRLHVFKHLTHETKRLVSEMQKLDIYLSLPETEQAQKQQLI